MRRAFLSRIAEMIPNEPDTVFMTVDIGMWAIKDVLKNYPDRCMNVGIFEDAMVSVAAGMASCGLIPTIFGIQPYLIERAYEQIKLDLAYMKNGINVVGTGAAIDYSKYGYSHYCAEDLAIIKQLPGIEFVAPGTQREFQILFETGYRNGNSTFYRISDHPNQRYDVDVVFGKANVIKTGNKLTVIAVSVMLDMVMDACEDEDVTVLYYTTLAPFDSETLRKHCNNGRLLICEPHYAGSLDSDILQAYEGESVCIEHIGLPREIFRNYGSYEEKMQYYGLTSAKIKEKIQKMIGEGDLCQEKQSFLQTISEEK